MIKYIKQILDMSKLVLNNLDNSRETKLDKSKLVFKKSCQFASYKTRQVQTCLKNLSILVIQNLTSLNLSETILSILNYNISISHHDEIHQTNTRQV